MTQPRPSRVVRVIKDEVNGQVSWSVYIYTADEWDKYLDPSTDDLGKHIDVFSAMDETTALSRARKEYPNYVIGENEDGYVKEWR